MVKRYVLIVLSFICFCLILTEPSQASIFRKTPESVEQVQLSFAPLVKQAEPAVVNIYSTRKIKVRNLSPFLSDPVFKHFFGNSFGGGRIKERQENSLGSGVIVKEDGFIITSNHVIAGSDEIKVVLSDRREFPAKVIIADEKTDLALLKIDMPNQQKLSYLELGNSDELEVGDLVLAIGNPFGVGQTVTSGIVSALARTTVGVSDYQFFIQTDAAINPGNSGGALITMDGKLVGINSAIYTRSGGSNGIGFAVPANMVATVIDSSAAGGQIVRPWTGITSQEVTQDVANSLGMERPVGALISEIYPNSPADKANLKVGDVIVAIDKVDIMDHHELKFRIATYKIGSSAKIAYLRNGKYRYATIEMQPAIEDPERDLRLLDGKHPLSGATIANISPAIMVLLGLPMDHSLKGVVVTTVEDGSAAQRLGVKRGDIVASVNDTKIETTKQLQQLVKSDAVERYKLSIQRGDRTLNIIVGGKF